MSTTLFTVYLYWQYVSAPQWLVQLYLNLQRVLWRYFSVGFMLRTLLAPWRRDLVSYRGLSLDRIALAVAWNGISRAVGAALRLIMIMIWVVTELLCAVIGAGVIVVFILWPFLILVGIATGLAVMVAG